MGQVKVTVQTEKRLEAINNLASAIKCVAMALSVGTQVNISDCKFTGGDPTSRSSQRREVAEVKHRAECTFQ